MLILEADPICDGASMPRYFFHISDSSSLDDAGTELPDIAAAQAEAVQMSGQIIKQGSMGNLWKDGGERGFASRSLLHPGDEGVGRLRHAATVPPADRN